MNEILIYHPVAINQFKANVIQVKNMIKAFRDCGVECYFVGFKLNGESDVKKEISSEWKPILNGLSLLTFRTYLGFGRLNIMFLLAYFKVLAQIKEKKITTVFTRSNALLNFLRLMSPKTLVVVELHNYRLAGPLLLHKYYIRILRKRKLNLRIIVISEALKQFFVDSGVPKNRILVQHDGVDLKAFQEPYVKDLVVRNPFPKDQTLVTYAGSLYKDRKIDRIVELAIKLRNINFLVLGGSIDDIKRLESAYQTMPSNLFFAGRVPVGEVCEWLKRSDILLALWSWSVPTMKYCSPLKVFEYLVSGKIMVVEAYPTIKEVLTEKNAILVEPENFDNLVLGVKKAIVQVLENDFPTENIDLVREHYTWKIRAKNIIDFVLQGN